VGEQAAKGRASPTPAPRRQARIGWVRVHLDRVRWLSPSLPQTERAIIGAQRAELLGREIVADANICSSPATIRVME
jgi:hypothetical protein